MVIVAVEEAADLLAVYGIVGGIEVKDQPLRGTTVRGDELLDQDLVQPPGGGPVGAVLPAAQRRGAGQWAVALDGRL